MSTDEPSSVETRAYRPRATARVVVIALAVVAGSGAVVLARRYKRPDPPIEPPPPGITVTANSVKLTRDAPAWSAIKLAPATAAEPQWGELVPGRITFDEARTSRLGSPLGGRVTAVFVERGQAVKRGAQLFTVSSPNLAELRAELEKATVLRGTARINFDRVKNLVEAGSIPAKEMVTAQQEVAEAELAVKLATQKLASLKVAGGRDATFTVTAPRDGVVVEKSIVVGQNVDPSAGSVMAIADLSDVWVVADLFETDVGTIAPGTKAKVMVGTAELDGAVDQVSGVVDPDRHTVPVRVKLANASGALRPNAYAQIRFFNPDGAKVAVLASAVLSDGHENYVYLRATDSELVRHRVVIGPPVGNRVPVLDGLAVGDVVVSQGAILLENQIQLEN